MVLLGSVMATGLSILSVNHYVDGIDRGFNVVMLDLAGTSEVKDGEPQTVAGFNVASRWQDMPELIQQRFVSEPSESGKIQVQKDQSSMFAIPDNVYFLVLHYNQQGEKRFVSKVMLEHDMDLIDRSIEADELLFWTFCTAFTAIAVFTFFIVMIMQKIARPIESLRGWAKSLDQDSIGDSPPDFTYTELNSLALFMQNNLMSAHQSLEREQRFLRYASHELRTPIAVVRSNVDLLQRLSENSPLTDKQQLTLQRILRAGLTMSNVTETLLWLSRNDEQEITLEPVNLSVKINQLCEDLNYLLNEKSVEVSIETEEFVVNIETIACHILLANLIRNAYQHTQYGTVCIKQKSSRVTIINTSQCDGISTCEGADIKQVASGYGLGLQLCEKIAKRRGWFYEVSDVQGRYCVVVDFDSKK
jgi:signal transduction histidine kinase